MDTQLLLMIAMLLAFAILGIGRIVLLIMKNKLDSSSFDKVVDEVQIEEPRLRDSRERAERTVLRRMIFGSVATSLAGMVVSALAIVAYVMTRADGSDVIWRLTVMLALAILVYAGVRLVVYRMRYARLYQSKCRAQRSVAS